MIESCEGAEESCVLPACDCEAINFDGFDGFGFFAEKWEFAGIDIEANSPSVFNRISVGGVEDIVFVMLTYFFHSFPHNLEFFLFP